ncbi:MAG: serine hydrolase, partial [Kaistella sp.]
MKNYCFLISIFLFISATVFGQTSDLIKSDGIVSPIHKENIGKIAFMGKTIAIENFKQTDFLSSFELKENTDLNIRVFLGNSLTNYLHALSPQLSAEELTKNGNYQFTFFVDGKKIYVENLNVGAGSAESKNQRTLFRVPLISSTNEDSWGKFLWNRFIANGGQEAFSNGEHLLKIEIRPYLKLAELVSGEIIAEGQLKIIVPEIKVDKKLIKIQTIK